MPIDSRLLDDLARIFGSAMGTAQGARHEVESLFRHQIERTLSAMELVSRDEFDAVRQMAAKARAEQEALEERLARLEARLASQQSPL